MNQETLYTMALSRLHGLGLKHAHTLYESLGGATDVFKGLNALRERLPEAHNRVFEILEKGRDEALRQAEQEAVFCEKHNIKVLCLNDNSYPSRLRSCDDAPLCLYYRGTANLNNKQVVSIVGTRRCTEYGKDLCANITRDLARLCPGTIIVSGLAYGIDVNAHRGALTNGLPTIAVLAHGLDRIYPSAHRNDAKRMLANGGLLTEYPIGTRPDKGNFVRRNRIIAGMCDACIVVESARKGGSIITARLAFDYNRQVFACPGRMSDRFSEGCNQLIHSNTANIFASAEDFVHDMGWTTQQELDEAHRHGIQTELFPQLKPEEQAIIDQLKDSDGKQINQIAQEVGQTIQNVSSLLFGLELQGLVKPMAGGVYRLIR